MNQLLNICKQIHSMVGRAFSKKNKKKNLMIGCNDLLTYHFHFNFFFDLGTLGHWRLAETKFNAIDFVFVFNLFQSQFLSERIRSIDLFLTINNGKHIDILMLNSFMHR